MPIVMNIRPESPRVTGNPRNAMICDTPYLQNEFGDPRFFFYVFNLILSFSTCSQSFKKICAWELLGANVLNVLLFIHFPLIKKTGAVLSTQSMFRNSWNYYFFFICSKTQAKLININYRKVIKNAVIFMIAVSKHVDRNRISFSHQL